MNHPNFTKLKTVALALILTISSSQLFAQTSNGIFFQAVARDNFSNPAKDRSIYVQTTILQTTTTGTKVLIEEHKANTDATGIFSISIGNGTRVGGTVANLNGIDWSKGPFFLNLKVSITPVGGTNSWDYTKEWVDMGTTNFGAVPFSFYAASVAGFDTKLNVADSAKMLLPYAKTTTVSTLSTSVDNKLATKLNIADSTNGYVTPAKLAAKTFDQTPITNAIATKLNIADSTNAYVTPAQLAAKTFDQTPITNAIATKLNLADSTKYVTPTQLAAKTFDTTSISNRINLKANASDMLNALSFKASNSDLISGLNLKLNTNQKGVANGVASLNAFGVIPSSQLPPVALSSTSVVGSELDMISLASATVGSIAIRTDLNKNYVLSATPASALSNWVELLTPAAPVQTVNGYTGTVNISKNDIGLSDVNNTSDLSKPISTATQAALATKISSADAAAALNLKLDANKVGAVNGVASLNALGKVPTDQIPAISFSSVKVLGSQAEMLALSSAVVGSVVIRTDVNKNFVLSATPASTIGNWIELLTPAPPVQTVNGYTGNISITKTDLGLGNVQNTSDADKTISTQTQTALDAKVDKVTGKALSTNDYTTAEKTKLAAITGTNTGDQDLSSYATNTNLALKANLASPTFTGTVTTSAINTGTLSSTSVTAPTYASTPKTLTYTGATINWNPAQGLNAAITLTQNSSLSFTSAPPVGSYGTVVLTQDATGSRTITLPSITGVSNKILGSTSTTTVSLSTAANSKDILNFYYDGANCYWNIGQGYGAASSSSNSGTTNLASSVTGILALANGGTGSATQNFVDLSTAQTIAGAKTFSNDLSVNGLTVGRGLGASASNTVVGAGTLYVNTTGVRNTAIGYASLVTNLDGADNTAVGYVSAYSNISGVKNTSIGGYSLYNNTSGYFNSAVGYGALYATTTGYNNASVGNSSMQNNTTGNNNTSIGNNSLLTNTVGNYNTAIGSLSDVNTNNLSNAIAIGYGARVNTSNTIQLGSDGSSFLSNAVTITPTPISNVKTSGTLTLGTVTYPNAHGTANQVLSTTGSGTLTWTTPSSSGVPYTGASAAVNLGAYDLTVNGVTAGRGALSRSNNYAFGYAVLSSNTTGNYNNAFGHQVLTANTNGQQNSAFGEYVLPKNIGGNFNTAMGTMALRDNTSGSGNTGFGQQALFTNSTGSNNTALGNLADVTVDGLSNTTAIGYNAKVSTSNTIQLGNSSVTNVNTSGAITAPIYVSTPQTLTDAANISWVPLQGLNASVTLAGNRTLSFSTPPASGAYGTLVVKQDATGGRTLTLPSVANKILGSSSTTTIGLSTTANAIDIINFYFDGTNYFWNVGQGYGSASTSSSTATNIAGGAAGSIPYQTAAGATSLLPKGTDGHVLTLASGIPSWSAPTGGSGSGGHYVGEVYGGGIVFYVTTGGYHGLIASSTDIVANPMTIFDRATSPSYKYATNSENLYTDWVTPTFSQLNILYSARATTGLNLGSFFYISSSNGENDAFSFKGLNFSNNVSGTVNGNWTTNGPEIRGRAIRTF